jgi:adenylate cyclase
MDTIKALQLTFLDIVWVYLHKITSLTNPNKISVGEDVYDVLYDVLHPQIKNKFIEIKHNVSEWKYADKQTGQLYKLYNTPRFIVKLISYIQKLS